MAKQEHPNLMNIGMCNFGPLVFHVFGALVLAFGHWAILTCMLDLLWWISERLLQSCPSLSCFRAGWTSRWPGRERRLTPCSSFEICPTRKCHLKMWKFQDGIELGFIIFKWYVLAFFSLSFPTKLHCYDVIMCAVEIWGQERGRRRVSGCPTCE